MVQERGVLWSTVGREWGHEEQNKLSQHLSTFVVLCGYCHFPKTDYTSCITGSQIMAFLLETSWSSLVTKGFWGSNLLHISLKVCFSSTSATFAPFSRRASPVRMAETWLPSASPTWTKIQNKYRLFHGHLLSISRFRSNFLFPFLEYTRVNQSAVKWLSSR